MIELFIAAGAFYNLGWNYGALSCALFAAFIWWYENWKIDKINSMMYGEEDGE